MFIYLFMIDFFIFYLILFEYFYYPFFLHVETIYHCSYRYRDDDAYNYNDNDIEDER